MSRHRGTCPDCDTVREDCCEDCGCCADCGPCWCEPIDCECDNGQEGDALIVLCVALAANGPAAHLRDNGGLTLIDTWSGEGSATACSLAAALDSLGCTYAALRAAVEAAYPPAEGWDWADLSDATPCTHHAVIRALGGGPLYCRDCGDEQPEPEPPACPEQP